jgi:hypothetical protein
VIADLRPLLDQAVSVGHKGAQFADLLGRHPDGRQPSRAEQPRQMERIARICLDPRGGNQLDDVGMDDGDRGHQRLQ